MATTPNFDYETQALNIARRRRVLEAMQAQSMQPMGTEQIGGMAIQNHWSNALAKLVQARAAKKGDQKLDQETQELKDRIASDGKKGVEDFLRTSDGYSYGGGVMKAGPDGRANPIQVPGDRRKAVMDAMASNHPMLQQLGQAMFQEDLKGQLSPKDLSGMANPADVLSNPSNPRAWTPKRDLMETTPGGVILDQNTGGVFTPGPRPDGKPAYNILERGGDVYQQTETGERKLDNAPNVTVNNALPPGAAFEKALAEAEAGRFSEALATRDQMMNASKALQEARQLVDQDLFTGIAGNLAMNAKRLDGAMFGGDQSKVAKTEQFIADMGTVILPAMKQLGGNDSNEELRRMEGWLAGDITLSPDAIRSTLDRFMGDLERQAGEIDAVANEVRQSTGIPTLNLPRYGGNPAAGTTAGGDGIETLEQYLQRMSGGVSQ